MTIWWAIMVGIGFVNLIAAVYIVCKSKRWDKAEPESAKLFRLLRICVVVFAAVAAYRTIFVSSYPDRMVWFDTILNSPFLIRCLATFAEMSAVTLAGVSLLMLNKQYGLAKEKSVYARAPYVSIACIFAAQFFAFAGLVTQYNTLFGIEEFLWMFAFLSFVPLVILGLKQIKAGKITQFNQTFFFWMMALWSVGYLAFQILYALPFMYFGKMFADAAVLIPPDAWRVAIFDYTVQRGFAEWGGVGFMIWHSVYFAVTIWVYLFGFMAARKRSEGKFL